MPVVTELQVTVELTAAVVGYKNDNGSVRVLLTNHAADARTFRVELGRFQLKGGDVVARATLPEHGKLDWADVPVASKGTVAVPVAVEGLTHLGTYDGSVKIRTSSALGAETVQPIQMMRLPSGLDLSFSGVNVANGVLTLKPTSADDTKFFFDVENTRSSGNAELEIAVGAEFGGEEDAAKLKVKTTALTLLPGQSGTVELMLSDSPPSGEYSGRLKILDKNSGATKHLDVRLQPSFVPGSHWAYIFLLVAVGALLSALVGAAIPNLISRNRLWRRIGVLRQELSALPAAEQYAKATLAREVQRVDELVYEADWYTPSAAERLAEQEVRTTELEQRLALLTRISECRSLAQTSSEIPSSSRVGLFRELDAVAANAAKVSLDVAKVQMEEVVKSIAAARVSTDIRSKVDNALSNLPSAVAAGADKVMEARLVRLRSVHAALGAAPSREELLELDYQAQCAHLYFKQFLSDILPNNQGAPAFVSAEGDLVKTLSQGKAEFIYAVALIESLQSGVTVEHMRNALSDLTQSADIIVSPSSPAGSELVTFRLAFRDNALNKSPLLRFIQVRWTFSAGASEGFGPNVGQHFRTSRKEQTVAFSVSVGPGPNQQLSDKLKIPSHPVLGSFVTQAEALSFSITLAGAVLLAILSKYAETRPLETVQDLINPFLWGFGLDRMKAIVTARTKA